MTARADSLKDVLAGRLAAYSPSPLDASRRGSGLNATWKILIDGRPAVLKTYSSRRGPLKTLLLRVEHAFTGRTSYSPAARHRTERNGLQLWNQAGFRVPALIDHDFSPPLPMPSLCMEHIEGRHLSAALADRTVPPAARQQLLADFSAGWGKRHAAAIAAGNPELIQEHATFEHVLLTPDSRFVTFDLEVAFVNRESVRELVSGEIAGYLRSLFKCVPAEEWNGFLLALIAAYPDRSILQSVPGEYLRSPSPVRRMAHRLLRNRRPGGISKYTVAERLDSALTA